MRRNIGADGTYLPSEYAKKLGIQLDEARMENDVTGVGGQRVEYVPFITQLKFESNGDWSTFDLSIGVFTQEESLDIPVLVGKNSSSFLFDGTFSSKLFFPTFSFRKKKLTQRNKRNCFF